MRNLSILLLGVLLIATGCEQMRFVKYDGQQKAWPTGSSFSDQVYAVPVFRGWPERPYQVLGYVEFNSPNVDWNQGDTKQAAEMAKKMGGDALLLVPKAESITPTLVSLRNDVGIDGSRTTGVVLKWK